MLVALAAFYLVALTALLLFARRRQYMLHRPMLSTRLALPMRVEPPPEVAALLEGEDVGHCLKCGAVEDDHTCPPIVPCPGCGGETFDGRLCDPCRRAA